MSAGNLGRYSTGWRHGVVFTRRRRQARAWRVGGVFLVLAVGAAFWFPWLGF